MLVRKENVEGDTNEKKKNSWRDVESICSFYTNVRIYRAAAAADDIRIGLYKEICMVSCADNIYRIRVQSI